MNRLLMMASSLVLMTGCEQTDTLNDQTSADAQEAETKDAEVGSSLNEKDEIAISEVPDEVLAAARAVRPDITFTEAEKELRNGVTYYDVGGADASGTEIELDIMQDGDGWRVVEVQRDISFSETPDAVRAALLAAAPEITPDRIIESDQTDGVIIYEFFTRDDHGVETKYEVKFEGGEATFLTEEWVH